MGWMLLRRPSESARVTGKLVTGTLLAFRRREHDKEPHFLSRWLAIFSATIASTLTSTATVLTVPPRSSNVT